MTARIEIWPVTHLTSLTPFWEFSIPFYHILTKVNVPTHNVKDGQNQKEIVKNPMNPLARECPVKYETNLNKDRFHKMSLSYHMDMQFPSSPMFPMTNIKTPSVIHSKTKIKMYKESKNFQLLSY